MTSIRVPFALEATPAMGMIDKLVGGMKKVTGAIGKAGVAAIAAGVGIGIFASRYMAHATQEAIKFQTEMVGLRKILGERPAMAIGEAIGDLSKEMPLARQELINVAETAARLGIRGTSNIVSFTRTMAMMGVATNISAEEAADALARVAKQTNLPVEKLENLGSVINELSNTMATSASEIVDAVRRSAPELARIGVPAEDIAALAATLNTVSESATRAGTRLRRVAQALTDPGKVDVFADALGKTGAQIREMRREDPTKLILDLVQAFGQGGLAADKLAAGLDARVRLALAALSRVQVDLNIALATGRDQMENNTSLYTEYSRILDIVSSKQQILTNRITETRREIGENMLPLMSTWLTFLNNIAEKLNFIFDRPMEGILTEEQLQRLEKASKELVDIRAEHDAIARGAAGVGFIGGTMGFEDGVTDRQAKVFRLELQKMTREAGTFGHVYAQMALTLIENNVAAKKSFGETRMQLESLGNAFVQLSDFAENNMDATIEVEKQLRSLNITFAETGAAGDEIARSTFKVAQAWNIVTDATEAYRTAMEESSKYDLTIEQEDLLDSLWKEYNTLTMTEGELIRQSAAYKDAERAIQDYKDTGEGNITNQLEFIGAVEWLIQKLEELRREQEANTAGEKAYQQALKDTESAARRDAEALKSKISALKEEYIALTQGAEAAQRFRYEQEFSNKAWVDMLMLIWNVNEALKKYKAEQDDAARREQAIRDRIQRRMELMDFGNVETRFRMLERVIDGLTDASIEFFESLVTGSGNAGQAIINMIRAVVEEFVRAQIMKSLLKWLGPAGMDLFSIGSAVEATGAEVTTAAKGGYLTKNKLAIVGERGPELFVPDVGGTVIPNNKLGIGQSETIILNNSFTINALDGSSVREVLAREQDFITGLSIDKIQRHRALKRR